MWCLKINVYCTRPSLSSTRSYGWDVRRCKRELNTYEWEKQSSYGLHGRTRARILSKILSLSHNFLRNLLSLDGFINTLHIRIQADHNPSSDSQIPVFIPSTNEQMSSLARFISRPSTYSVFQKDQIHTAKESLGILSMSTLLELFMRPSNKIVILKLINSQLVIWGEWEWVQCT